MSNARVAILISGSGTNMEALLKAMLDEDHPGEPCVVIADNPNAGGIEKAGRLGVPTRIVSRKEFPTKQAFEDALIETLNEFEAELICLAGFMRVLSGSFVDKFENRILNIHPSLLPLFKGLHTHRRALQAGVTMHGCSVHVVTAALDDGKILGQAAVAVEENDTEQSLAARVMVQEHRLYPTVLRAYLEGSTAPITLFPKTT